MSNLAWKMNRQAADQMQAMCIPPQVVNEVLTNPERTYDTSSNHARRTPNGPRRFYYRGTVGILVGLRDKTILGFFLPEGEDLYSKGGWIDY